MENDNKEEESSEQLTNEEFTFGLKTPISGPRTDFTKPAIPDPWIDIPVAIFFVIILCGSFVYLVWELIKYLSK